MLHTMSAKTILYVTAFKALGRESWKHWARPNDNYFQNFRNLLTRLKYDLVVFIENSLAEKVRETILEVPGAADRVTVMDYSAVDSFIAKHLAAERACMQGGLVQSLTAHRRDCPETYIAEYTLVNHSKINFVRHAQAAQPGRDFYAWVDFGMCNDPVITFPLLDLDELPDRVMYNTLRQPPVGRPDERALLQTGDVFLTGDSFIVPAALVETLERRWEGKLLEWQRQGLADDDQSLVLQLYYDDPKMFFLTIGGRWYVLNELLPRLPVAKAVAP